MTWENIARPEVTASISHAIITSNNGNVSTSGTIEDVIDQPFFEYDLDNTQGLNFRVQSYGNSTSSTTRLRTRFTVNFVESKVRKVIYRWTASSGLANTLSRIESVRLNSKTIQGTINRNSDAFVTNTFNNTGDDALYSALEINMFGEADAIKSPNGWVYPLIRHDLSFITIYTELYTLNIRFKGKRWCGVKSDNPNLWSGDFKHHHNGETYDIAFVPEERTDPVNGNGGIPSSNWLCYTENAIQRIVEESET